MEFRLTPEQEIIRNTTGSDAANIRTTATRQKESYVLNGTKTLITSGEASRHRHLGGRRPECEKKQGDQRLRLEKGTPGFRLGTTLYEGTAEVQRIVTSREILKG